MTDLKTLIIGDLLIDLYPDINVQFGDTYASINIPDGYTKISETEYNTKYQEKENEIIYRILREERDQLLLNTDRYVLADYPFSSDEKKQEWLAYRQALRDLPNNQTPQLDSDGMLTNVTWPTPPS
mgnify:CR=1 FL=1